MRIECKTGGVAENMKTVVMVILGALCVLAVVALALTVALPARRSVERVGPPFPKGVLVVGAGLTGAACVQALPDAWGRASRVRDADGGMGGRALSVPSPAARPSTAAAPDELGAWCFQPLLHDTTLRLLQSLRAPYLDVTLVSATQSFIFDAATGKRRPWGTLPPSAQLSGSEVSYAAAVSPDDGLLWFAHTGLWRDDFAAGEAALDAVAVWDAPLYAAVPAGFGWQDVVGRALGTTSVAYGQRVTSILSPETSRGGDDNDAGRAWVEVQFASGHREHADAVVLTVPPPSLAALTGVKPEVRQAASTAFVTVASGVLFATWDSVHVWWPAAGWTEGMVACSSALGRMVIVNGNQLRLAVSGRKDVEFWNDVFVRQGTAAALAQVGTLLRQVFPEATDPATATFKPWATGTHLWRAGIDRAATHALLRRPCGEEAPVWWGSADAALQWASWVEGAVREGQALAQAVVATAPAPAPAPLPLPPPSPPSGSSRVRVDTVNS